MSALKRTIAVAGTHGKTTTASMATLALVDAGRDPAFLIGGELRALGANAGWGGGDWAVVEADESDRSFLKLAREVAVVTSVELDHHATYRSLGELERAFESFIAPGGAGRARPGRGAARPGTAASATASTPAISAPRAWSCCRSDRASAVEGVEIELAVPGRHNVLNALAALAACRAAGVEPAQAAPGLARFTGAGRRFEDHGLTAGGARVFDDYAHHPTEVRATLGAARTQGPRRLVVCFQPHLFSRTRLLAREFGRALALADLVVVLDIYPARERAGGLPRGQRAARGRGRRGRRRRAAPCGGCPASPTPSASCARSSARATCS